MKNPYLNAIAAGAYIVTIVFVMDTVTSTGSGSHESILIPMTVLSLFTLSAAVMGFLFLATPARLYMDGAKQEAVTFFFKTVATFAAVAALFVALLLTIGRNI